MWSRRLRLAAVGPWIVLLVGTVAFGHNYANPMAAGVPAGIDLGFDAAYLGPFREELLRGRLLTWYSVHFDGVPLLGHPLTQVFYPPLILPTVAFGTAAGLRVAYLLSLFFAGAGTYFLSRVLGARRSVAVWAGLIFVMSGTIGARIYAGHLEKVLAIPLVPWVFGAVLLSCRMERRGAAFGWAVVAGLAHGATFLAGDSYLLLYLMAATPLALGLGALKSRYDLRWQNVVLRWAGWATGLVAATAGKLLAAADILDASWRVVRTFRGSQDWYWSVAHLIYPSFLYGPTLPWQDASTHQDYEWVPGPGEDLYNWFEYTQFVGVVPALLALIAIILVMPPVTRGFRHTRSPVDQANVAALVGVAALSALWLADAFWYSPVHWLYQAVPPLQQFRIPSRALMLFGPVVVALAALGLELLLRRSEIARGRLAWRTLLALIAVGAVINVYMVTHRMARVAEHPAGPAFEQFVALIRRQDSGPFLVGVDSQLANNESTVMLELSERAVRIGRNLAPLVPRFAEQRTAIASTTRVRYFVTREGNTPPADRRWEILDRSGSYVLFRNLDSHYDAWQIRGGDVRPADVILAEPTRFFLRSDATEGAFVVAPANAFPGWQVSVDGGPPSAAINVEGYAAVAATPGDHTYEFSYQMPLLGPVLALAALPWLVFAILATLWVRACRSQPDLAT